MAGSLRSMPKPENLPGIVQTTTPNDGRYITGAPLVLKDTVIIGHAEQSATIRGYVTAYDTPNR